jgi:hypothetical protein
VLLLLFDIFMLRCVPKTKALIKGCMKHPLHPAFACVHSIACKGRMTLLPCFALLHARCCVKMITAPSMQSNCVNASQHAVLNSSPTLPHHHITNSAIASTPRHRPRATPRVPHHCLAGHLTVSVQIGYGLTFILSNPSLWMQTCIVLSQIHSLQA